MHSSSFAWILRDREAVEEILELIASNREVPGARELDVEPGRIELFLRRTEASLESATGSPPAASEELEAIVRLYMRPSLLLEHDHLVVPSSATWRRRLEPVLAELDGAIASVGRVDLLHHGKLDWCGTAWVVAENTVVTNRHVVEEFARRDDDGWVFVRRRESREMEATVDFRSVPDPGAAPGVRVVRIHWVWEGPGPVADLALLELEAEGLPDPIPLAEEDGAPDRFVAVVGYPSRDDRNEVAASATIFGDRYGVKRFAPGQITRVPDAIRFEHDCSTLGGNSGSLVLDLDTGHAIGLHFGGSFKKANQAVRASVVRDALARARIPVPAPRAKLAPTGAGRSAAMEAGHRFAEGKLRSMREAVKDPAAPLPLQDARRELEALRDVRRLPELVALGERIVRGGQDHPMIRRLLAQGQIELGALDDALRSLEQAAGDLSARLDRAGDPSRAPEALWIRKEQAEVQGLLGRVHKQRYLAGTPTADDPRTADAERAAACYGEAYRASPVENLWHGINVVALRNHQHRLTRTGPTARDAEADRIAEDVLRNIEVIEENGTTTYWDDATRAEALLALDRLPEFWLAVDALLARPDLTAFAVNSFRRQLRELWELDAESPPGQDVLPRLDRWLEASRAKSAPGGGPRAPEKVEFVTEAADNRAERRARGVARIGPSFYFGEGTGFLIDPLKIWPEYAGPRNVFLLTNAHVCSADADPSGTSPPFHPRAARFLFLGPKGEVGREVLVSYAESLWSSPTDDLDATLLLLESGPTVDPFPVRESAPKVGESASLVGCPLGAGLWYSLAEDAIREVGRQVVLYTTRTESGMSGSPVFDGDWGLLALHRHYGADIGLNGGVRIDRILAAMKKDLVARFGPAGPNTDLDPVRTEDR